MQPRVGFGDTARGAGVLSCAVSPGPPFLDVKEFVKTLSGISPTSLLFSLCRSRVDSRE